MHCRKKFLVGFQMFLSKTSSLQIYCRYSEEISGKLRAVCFGEFLVKLYSVTYSEKRMHGRIREKTG